MSERPQSSRPRPQVTDISRLDEREPQDRIDLLVAIALGEVAVTNMSDTDLLIAMAEEGSNPVATALCSAAITVDDLRDNDPTDYFSALKGTVSTHRLKRINSWDHFTKRELKMITDEATLRDGHGDTFEKTEYFELKDSKGRSVYYSQVSNDDLGFDHQAGDLGGPYRTISKEREPEEVDDEGNLTSYHYYGSK